MVQTLLEHPDLQTLSHHLRTEDAHGLYEPFGFKRIEALRRSTKPDDVAAPLSLDAVQRASQEQFSRQSHRYGQGHVLENIDDVRAAAAQMALSPKARVLDVATGGGHTGLFFASLGHDVTLADISQSMLERAAKTAAERGLTVQTRLHAAEQFPYPDADFDLVTCRVAPHHFSSPSDFVHESARVLRPGGWFLLIDGSIEDDQPEAEEWLHCVEKYRDPSHHRLLSPRTWTQLCERHGLVVCQAVLNRFKQPDLNWFFETAATPPESRSKVLDLIANAPESARKQFGLAEENGTIVWWWPRLTLIARKPGGQ
jgi:ubiquinone/menaquinone biosynthesis C-methylase UbiE